VRSLLLLTLLATTAVAGAKPSNPAFLGIGMQDMPRSPGQSGPCIVTEVTRGSGAKAAGLHKGDELEAIDGAIVPNCDAVLRTVQAHQAGDTVAIAVVRNGRPVALKADLLSREEIMRRRLVGQPIVATDLFGVDDQRSVDLSAFKGKTAIVGWFDVRRCTGCTQVFGKLADWSRTHQAGFPPMPLAVTAGEPSQAKQLTPIGLDVPLALADAKLYEELTVPDADRINFMVIDCRGVVQYVAPIAPEGDDTAAAIDELFAAAEQASRRTTK
jgi:membrane-associated protease RseP (regulator of RpoE activity)